MPKGKSRTTHTTTKTALTPLIPLVHIGRGGGALLKATTSGKIVGALFYKPEGKALYFGRLAVLAAYQKQGIARQLIEHVERAAKAEGFESVTLGVRIM